MQNINENDRVLLRILRDSGHLSVPQLCEKLDVTATAVRQKLDRLGAASLLNRIEVRNGVGRPSFQYAITPEGTRTLGTSQAEFADVVWDELLQIEDEKIRTQLIARISERMASGFLLANADGLQRPLSERLEAVAEELRNRNMPVTVVADEERGLPVLRFTGCPYPDLSEKGHDICEMETKMLSRMAGHSMQLAECRCHASDGACTYVPINK